MIARLIATLRAPTGPLAPLAAVLLTSIGVYLIHRYSQAVDDHVDSARGELAALEAAKARIQAEGIAEVLVNTAGSRELFPSGADIGVYPAPADLDPLQRASEPAGEAKGDG